MTLDTKQYVMVMICNSDGTTGSTLRRK